MTPADEALIRAARALYAATHAYYDAHSDRPLTATYEAEQWMHGARAFVRSLEADGWLCVPKMATKEMVDCIQEARSHGATMGPVAEWAAMSAVAPRLTGDER